MRKEICGGDRDKSRDRDKHIEKQKETILFYENNWPASTYLLSQGDSCVCVSVASSFLRRYKKMIRGDVPIK